MAASAYRHCLATETPDITTSEGQGRLVISLRVGGRHLAAAGAGNDSLSTLQQQLDEHDFDDLLIWNRENVFSFSLSYWFD